MICKVFAFINVVYYSLFTLALSLDSKDSYFTLLTQSILLEALGEYALFALVCLACRFGPRVSGGMGMAYLAKHALLRRRTVVKVRRRDSSPQALDRFEREVQLTSELTHPNPIAERASGAPAAGRSGSGRAATE